MAFDIGRALSSTLSGAGSGAGLGSIIPGIGTGIGAAGGGILGFLSSLFGGGGNGQDQLANMSQSPNEGIQNIPRFSPEQMQNQDFYRQLARRRLEDIFGGKGGNPLENQALNQFSQQIVPGIAERFSSLGSGAQRSSAFSQSLSQAGGNLASNLSAKRQQQIDRFLPMLLQMGNQQQFDPIYQPPQQQSRGFFESIAPGLASGLGQAGGALATNAIQSYFGGGS